MSNNIFKCTIAFPFKSGWSKFDIKKQSEWSVVDYIFLKEISKRSYNLNDLCEYSNLQKQLVIQILLPLMKMGWVELETVNNDFNFVVTELGKIACEGDKLPNLEDRYERGREFLVDINNRYYGVNVEGLLPQSEARVNQLQRDQENFFKFILPDCEVYPNYDEMYKAVANPNEIVVSHLGDFHYGIKDTKYILFDAHYDRNLKKLFFQQDDLINKFSPRIKQIIRDRNYDEIVENKKSNSRHLKKYNFDSNYSYLMDFNSLDIVLGAEAHRENFLKLIRESEGFLIIHSTFIGKWSIIKSGIYTEYFEEIRKALARNVRVYILWGKDEPDEDDENYEKSKNEIASIEKLLNEFNDYCLKSGILNVVNFNDFSKTGSHTKFVISKGLNNYNLLFSSCNFFYTHFERFESSLLITDRKFVKDFLRIAADISSGRDLHSGSIRNDFMRYSTEIFEENNREVTQLIKVNLVLKYQHYDYIDLVKRTCKKHLYILSDKFNSVAERPIIDALKKSTAQKFAFYSCRADNFSVSEERRLVNKFSSPPYNVKTRIHDPKKLLVDNKKPKKNHAKVLAWDDDHILITSLNWLSSNASKAESQKDIYHEIGIYVEKSNIAFDFLKIFNDL